MFQLLNEAIALEVISWMVVINWLSHELHLTAVYYVLKKPACHRYKPIPH